MRGIDDPMSRQVLVRADREGGDAAPIGYRRAPVTIRHEGWALEIPGSYAERRTPEEWWGGGLGRNITLAAVQTATDGGAMGAQAFVDHVGGDLGPEAIDHRAGGVIGRARLSSDTSSGLEVGVLDGYSAVVGSGRRDQDRVRRPGRLAVGTRHVAVARAWLSLCPAATRRDNRPMYVPAHFKPDDAEVLELLGSGRAANLITAHERRPAGDDAAAGPRRPRSAAGSRAMGRPPRARGTQQRPVEDACDRRGDGHRRRPRRLHLAGVVRDEA